MEEVIKNRDEYKELFYKTGNLYYFLIAQELTKIIETKLENEKNQEVEEEQGLGL